MVTRSILRPVLRPMPLPLMDDDGPSFPRSLFSAGEQGVWFDPSDFSSLFQDAGETTPVTAVGQPVVRMRDKSGRGNHATLSNCTLEVDADGFYCIRPNGTSSKGETAAINFGSTSKMTCWSAVRPSSTAAGMVVELSANATTTNGSFWGLFVNNNSAGRVSAGARPTVAADSVRSTLATYGSGILSSFCTTIDLSLPTSTDKVKIYRDKASVATIALSEGADTAGNFGNHALYLFSRGGSGSYFSGDFYGLIIRGDSVNESVRNYGMDFLSRRAGRVMYGKSILTFGDSITGSYNYPAKLADETGADVTNFGVGGTRLAQGSSNYDALCFYKIAQAIASGDFSGVIAGADTLFANTGQDVRARMAALAATNFSSVSYFVVFYGTNDWNGSIPLGTDSDNTGATFKGAFNLSLSLIRAAYPHLRIVFAGPMFRSRNAEGDGLDSDNNPNSNGTYLVEYGDAVAPLADDYDVKFLDMYRTSGVTLANSATYLIDGLHPNPAGEQLIARRVRTFIYSEFA